ncbi:type I-C CRISPR-associated endonuclease Cas1c [Fundicoccus culcitae]|uniref:CRISPR-associated endonuclease Cas1 n=1 Tax=Fundicoccus culcitae TaxID=2969821 RepID=A0ABY5P241_9LACT|nr:type I-C CRISPR-associated endonuclease Cas1c [Fundicoccus culcitae]UUX32769.1 type I-C CRISPR-associated endonuclease Cas1c [Fundicoccus culcitae]
MRKLLNTLFVTQPDSYLALENDNVILLQDDSVVGRVPLLNIESIVTFGYRGVSPSLMGKCVDNNISVTFLTSSGRFKARVIGSSRGNVTLRKEQYRISDDEKKSCEIARNMIIAKVNNNRWIIERMTREHPLRISLEKFKNSSRTLKEISNQINVVDDLESLRGWEGQAALNYFGLFDEMILQQEKDFHFNNRNRRPPRDPVNAMLSLAYTLLMHDMTAALETVGLDAYVGFLHRDRPGRASLALDMIEELRGVYADRFVLSLINLKIVSKKHFHFKENGAVLLTDDGRKIFLNQWHKKKNELITHPYLKEKISWGLVPYSQALLLSRFIRGDLDTYPPFLWK